MNLSLHRTVTITHDTADQDVKHPYFHHNLIGVDCAL